MAKKPPDPPLEFREFRSSDEISAAIAKLQRRLQELERIDIQSHVIGSSGAIDAATSNLRATILEVFGPNSPEFREHQVISLWDGPVYVGMSDGDVIEAYRRGCIRASGILNGLIGRLKEKQEESGHGTSLDPSNYFDRLTLHPRILEASRDLFFDGHPWEAVFAAAKTLINYVKDRSSRHDLDGATLVRAVFSPNNPVLSFNDLVNQTDRDEQEGMMHLFEGAVLAIRNPGGHTFPEGPEQRALEYLSFLSLLAYRVQEAQRRRGA